MGFPRSDGRLSLLVVNRRESGGGPLRVTRINALTVLAVFEHGRFSFGLFVVDGFLSRGVGLKSEESALPLTMRHATETHLGSPFARLPWLETRFAVHGVDHFQRDTRALVQEKVGKDGGGEVAPGKDESVGVLDLVGDEGGEEGLVSGVKPG